MAKILIVEDEVEIRQSVSDWLMFEGHDVFIAENGLEGLAVARNELPEMIISDIRMPEMDGHEFLLEVRSDPYLSGVSFIFLTASAERASIRKGMDMGADDYLTKPFTHSEVIDAVNAIFSKRSAQNKAHDMQIHKLYETIEMEREKLQLKSRMVAMFSHDFRNPLTSILSSASILESYRDRLSPEREKQHFDRISGGAHILLQMLDEMLMVAEMENGHLECHPESIHITECVAGVVSEFQLIHQDTHTIKFVSDIEYAVDMDRRLLRHIAMNLISNAVKYSAKGSSVQVELLVEGSYACLSVQDQGIGIPETDIPSLFEPFYRASNAQSVKGSGLGLSLVQQAAELCGGRITVASEINKGSTFTYRFPLKLPV